jgi:hypothetical protein
VILTLSLQLTTLIRLLEVQELVQEILLVAASTEAERRYIVVAGLAADSVDVLASPVGFRMDEQDGVVVGMVGVGAAFLVRRGFRLNAQRRRLGNVDRRDRVEKGEAERMGRSWKGRETAVWSSVSTAL